MAKSRGRRLVRKRRSRAMIMTAPRVLRRDSLIREARDSNRSMSSVRPRRTHSLRRFRKSTHPDLKGFTTPRKTTL